MRTCMDSAADYAQIVGLAALRARKKRMSLILNYDLLDSVVRGLEGVEAESLPEMVVVANLFNGVVLDVQPF